MEDGTQPDWPERMVLQLRTAMDWVIPPDDTPGAGSAVGAERLLELLGALGPDAVALYEAQLPGLREENLADVGHPFASLFINHVRDVYYAYPETGSWADIGFVVTD